MSEEPPRIGGDSVDEVAVGSNPSTTDAALRLQILSTEHWSLLASRSLAWNESFSRAGMFLATLSGATVALALVAQVSDFGEAFTLFALVILPVVLFIGVATVIRLGSSNYHDGLCVLGMNRIRHAYLEIAPELEPYFVMSPHDDARGLFISMGLPPGGPRVTHFLAATPMVISVINSIVAAVIAVVAAIRLGGGPGLVAVVAGLIFFATFGLHQLAAVRAIARAEGGLRPLFPSPGPSD